MILEGMRISMGECGRNTKPRAMLKNYLLTAIRSFNRNKMHTTINVAGLSLAIACCVLVAWFVKDELAFDRFHSRADRLFRVYNEENTGQNTLNTSTPFAMGPALKDNLAEIEGMSRFSKINTQVIAGDRRFTEYVTIVGADFLSMFDFGLVRGSRHNALETLAGVALTENTARKYFGAADPLHKTIAIQIGERFEHFTVTAILKNLPSNSSIQFQMLISDQNYRRLYSEERLTSAWFNVIPETYVLLRPGVDAQALTARFPAIFRPRVGADIYDRTHYRVGLQPLTAIHLDTAFPPAYAAVGNPRHVYILAAIALLILVVACLNFITLSVGRSLKRAREVAVRKVAGARRRQLVLQFVAEGVIITAAALVAGLLLAVVCLPVFNDLAGKQLQPEAGLFLAAVVLVLMLAIGLLAGSYPAWVLSGFKPAAIFKGTRQSGNTRQSVRKVLVGIQLVFSISLLAGTALMRDQLHLLQTRHLGFDREQLVVVPLNIPGAGKLRERIYRGFEKAALFKAALTLQKQVASVCVSSHDFAGGDWMDLGFTDHQGTYRTFFYNTVDEDYLPTLNAELAAGRNFLPGNPVDARRAIIVNEAFVKAYGWKYPLGQRLPGPKFQDHEVIGVVKDFHYASLHTRIAPLVLAMDPAAVFDGIENMNFGNSPMPKLLIRLRPGDPAAALGQIQATWKQITGGEEFDFTFADAAIEAQYISDQNLGRIVGIAAVLAMVIGSLGLYGLATLAMQSRTKEISIRKVLGATMPSLSFLLAREYVVLVGIAFTAAVPLIYWAMHNWLAIFEYRIMIGAAPFLVAGSLSMLMALVTVGHQVVKTARSQPAQTLKQE